MAISGPAAKVGQPAHALQRKNDLPDARRDRLVQRGERFVSQDAVRLQAVPGLEPLQPVGERLRQPAVGRAGRVRREIAQPHELRVQGGSAGVGVTRDDLAARRCERRQGRCGLPGEQPVFEQHPLQSRVLRETRLGRGDQCGNAIARHRVAQLGHERRVLRRRPVVGLDPLRRRAAEAKVGEELQRDRAQGDVGTGQRIRVGSRPLRRFDLAFQCVDVVVLGGEAAVGGSPQLAQRSGDGRARTIGGEPDGAGARGRIDALQPGAIDSACERRRTRRSRPARHEGGDARVERRIERRAPGGGEPAERHADDAVEPRQIQASCHSACPAAPPAALIPP